MRRVLSCLLSGPLPSGVCPDGFATVEGGVWKRWGWHRIPNPPEADQVFEFFSKWPKEKDTPRGGGGDMTYMS